MCPTGLIGFKLAQIACIYITNWYIIKYSRVFLVQFPIKACQKQKSFNLNFKKKNNYLYSWVGSISSLVSLLLKCCLAGFFIWIGLGLTEFFVDFSSARIRHVRIQFDTLVGFKLPFLAVSSSSPALGFLSDSEILRDFSHCIFSPDKKSSTDILVWTGDSVLGGVGLVSWTGVNAICSGINEARGLVSFSLSEISEFI